MVSEDNIKKQYGEVTFLRNEKGKRERKLEGHRKEKESEEGINILIVITPNLACRITK